jgi:prepilin-type processing-associated H-X9-DG protein
MYCNDNDQILMTGPHGVDPKVTSPPPPGWYGCLGKYTQNDQMFACPAMPWAESTGQTAVTGHTYAFTTTIFPGYATNNYYFMGTQAQQWVGHSLDYFQAISHFVLWVEAMPLDPARGWVAYTGNTKATTDYTPTVVINGNTQETWWDGGWPGPWMGWGGGWYPAADPPYCGYFSWNPGGGDGGMAVFPHNGFMNCGFLDGHAKAVGVTNMMNADNYYLDAEAGTVGVGQAIQ